MKPRPKFNMIPSARKLRDEDHVKDNVKIEAISVHILFDAVYKGHPLQGSPHGLPFIGIPKCP